MVIFWMMEVIIAMQTDVSAEAISLLFAPDAQPVIGVRGRTVLFLNPAAQRLFGDVPSGTALRRLLPEHAAMHQGSAFFTTARIRGVPHCITLSSMPGFRIFRLEQVRTGTAFPDILAPSDLFSMELGLAATYFSNYAATQEDLGPRHYAARLEHTAEQLRRWVRNADTLQRLRHGQAQLSGQLIDCAATLSAIMETVQPMLDRRGMHIALSLPESGCSVRISPELFETLVLNLLSNALRSSPEHSEIRIQLMKGTNTAHLVIRDAGEGFPEGVLPDVFHAHAVGALPRSDRRNAGYGLPVCFAIADHIGGAILIENVRGGGAAVHVVFPLSRSERMTLHAPPDPRDPELRSVCRTALSDALSDEDYL